MEISFKNPSAVFNNPSTHMDEKYFIRKWIMLPMAAQKVLLSHSKGKELNLFQETVLKLFKNGKKTEAEAADILKIDLRLAKHIIEELCEKGYLKEGLLTSKGESILLEAPDKSEMKDAYVFYDLIGKFYWNVIIAGEDFNELKPINEKARWKVPKGKVGDSDFCSGILVLPKSLEYRELKNSEVAEIIKSHKKRTNNLRRSRQLGEDNIFKINPLLSSKMQLLSNPIPLMVPTFIYIPRDLSSGTNWQVCSPFGYGISLRYRDVLEKYMESSESNPIKNLVENMYKEIDITGSEAAQAGQRMSETREYIRNIFTLGIESYPRIFKILEKLCEEYKELYAGRNSGKNYEKNQNVAAGFIQSLYQLLEESFYELKEKYGEYDLSSKLLKESVLNSHLLSGLAEKFGFTKDEDRWRSFFNLNKGKIVNAGISKELKALVAANLLIAAEDSDHPFHILGDKGPGLINFLININRLRGEQAHASGEEVDLENLRGIFKKVCIIVSHSLENLSLNYTDPDFNRKRDELEIKIHTICENKIDSRYDKSLKKYVNLRKYLIETEIFMEKLQKKLGNESGSRVAVALGKVYEEILLILKKDIFTEEASELLKDGSKIALELLEEKLLSFGFKVDFEKLPLYFKRVDIRKIRGTFKNFNRGVLTTKFYTVMYSAAYKEPEIIKLIGKNIPEFITAFAEINSLRGHGDREVSMEEAERNIDKTFKIVNSLLIVLKEKNGGE